jgi:hypothetical protein
MAAAPGGAGAPHKFVTSGCQLTATRSISRIVRKNSTEKQEPYSTVA